MERIDLSALDGMSIPPIDGGGEREVINVPEELPELEDRIEQSEEEVINERTDLKPPTMEEMEDTIEDPSDETPAEDGSIIKFWADWASEKGIIDPVDAESFEDSEEFLFKQVENRIKREVDTRFESLPDGLRELVSSGASEEAVRAYLTSDQRLQSYQQIDPEKLKEDIDTQKALIRDFYASQDYEPDAIDRRLEKLEEAYLLEDEADMALKRLTHMEAQYKNSIAEHAQRQQEEYARQVEAEREALKESIMKSESFIPGLEVSETDRQKVYDAITKPIARDEYGNLITPLVKAQMEDPHFLEKVAYAAIVMGWDFNKQATKSKNKAITSSLRKAVDRTHTDSKLDSVDIKTLKKAMRGYERSTRF